MVYLGFLNYKFLLGDSQLDPGKALGGWDDGDDRSRITLDLSVPEHKLVSELCVVTVINIYSYFI